MSKNELAVEDPTAIDRHVGGQVRLKRILLGFSQENVAEQLGLSFQQLQKYEHGTNRISASKLYALSEILRCSPGDFFPSKDEGMAAPANDAALVLATRLGARTLRVLADLSAEQLRSILNIAHVIHAANAANAADLAQAAE